MILSTKSNVASTKSNVTSLLFPFLATMSNKVSSFRQSRNELNMFSLFRYCQKNEISRKNRSTFSRMLLAKVERWFDIVAVASTLLLVWTGPKAPKNIPSDYCRRTRILKYASSGRLLRRELIVFAWFARKWTTLSRRVQNYTVATVILLPRWRIEKLHKRKRFLPRGICCRRVCPSVRLSVCHTPVLYQNG